MRSHYKSEKTKKPRNYAQLFLTITLFHPLMMTKKSQIEAD